MKKSIAATTQVAVRETIGIRKATRNPRVDSRFAVVKAVDAATWVAVIDASSIHNDIRNATFNNTRDAIAEATR